MEMLNYFKPTLITLFKEDLCFSIRSSGTMVLSHLSSIFKSRNLCSIVSRLANFRSYKTEGSPAFPTCATESRVARSILGHAEREGRSNHHLRRGKGVEEGSLEREKENERHGSGWDG